MRVVCVRVVFVCVWVGVCMTSAMVHSQYYIITLLLGMYVLNREVIVSCLRGSIAVTIVTSRNIVLMCLL